MISRQNRFPMRTRFLEFRRFAQKLYSPHLTLLYSFSDNPQLAVVVSKKVNRRAVVRNRLKRLLKQQLLDFRHLGKLVVLVKPVHLEKSQLEPVSQELHALLLTLSKTGTTSKKLAK